MGLDGDALFPAKYRGIGNRPTAVVQNVQKTDDEYLVNLKLSNGATKTVSSMTLSPTDVWEFTDKSFEGVVRREKAHAMEQHRAEQELQRAAQAARSASPASYRATSPVSYRATSPVSQRAGSPASYRSASPRVRPSATCRVS